LDLRVSKDLLESPGSLVQRARKVRRDRQELRVLPVLPVLRDKLVRLAALALQAPKVNRAAQGSRVPLALKVRRGRRESQEQLDHKDRLAQLGAPEPQDRKVQLAP
jgi:hypothetical protein